MESQLDFIGIPSTYGGFADDLMRRHLRRALAADGDADPEPLPACNQCEDC